MLLRGRVSLVGAGPGDPELITVRGLRRLQAADVVVYDRLVDPRLLDEAPPCAERINVGKIPGGGPDQRAIECLLIDRARAGAQVVRLKGGDPFVFGRGGEELAALAFAGIEVEIVPGLSSATAVPALAGIPVTHRGTSSALTIVTAHEDPGKHGESVDWEWLAAGSGTMVILMGLGRLHAICARLIDAGRAPTTPAAIIASGSLPDEQIVVADLAHLPNAARAADLRSPALIVVGEVARFRETLPPACAGGLGDHRSSARANGVPAVFAALLTRGAAHA
jgi:uroporphyrin-III C-methyltransferase